MIKENVQKILAELPPGVELVAAAKTRTAEEILQAASAGVKIVGQNYVQEAQSAFSVIGHKVAWHFIGHLQKNKVKPAVEIFDLIETVDSFELALEINKRCQQIGKVMPVFIEVNSGEEEQKFGVAPGEVEGLLRKLAELANIKVAGLMTMGPFLDDPEKLRPLFAATKRLFDRLKALNIAKVDLQYLSMGMSDSYRVAIEEGANLIRVGGGIFGPRDVKI